MKLYFVELASMAQWGNAVHWLDRNVNGQDVTYFWPTNRFTFAEYADALAFMLVFEGSRAVHELTYN